MSFHKVFLVIFFFSITIFGATAQPERPAIPEQKSLWDKIYIGGTFGLQFGNNTFVDLAPQFGYRLTDRLMAGVGVTYIYYKYTDPYHVYPAFSSNVYGGNIFSRYLVWENLFAQVE